MREAADRGEPPRRGSRRRKSMTLALLLWFFFGVFAAHKFYLGRIREGFLLLLAYFLLPAAVAAAAVFAATLLGVRIAPPDLSPEAIEAFMGSGIFLGIFGAVLAVLIVLWIWDFRVLRRQVRAHNAGVEAEASGGEREAG